jgi:hypothetical protein
LEFREQERSVAGACNLDHLSKGSHKSISNTQKALPLAKFAFKADALGDLET